MSIDKIKKILFESKDGIITSKQISEQGIHRGYLTKMVENGDIIKIGRGLYMNSNIWEDEIYILQTKFHRGIFSHETALYLLGFSDRVPHKFTMSFPQGYSTHELENEPIYVKRIIKENFYLGIQQIETPYKNIVNVYDIERTLCDIVKGQGCDIQIIKDAMKKYVSFKYKDIPKLLEYSEILRVKSKIQRYMEVLL